MSTLPNGHHLPADDRPALDWDNPRRVVDHALGYGPRLKWRARESVTPAAGVDGLRGVGDAITVTYTRGTGAGRETVIAHFREIEGFDGAYRFAGGSVVTGTGAGARSTPVRVWGHLVTALYARPIKVRRGPRNARPGTRTPA